MNVTKQKTCGKDHTYNGWTNYETWAVALWIDNDEGMADQRVELGRRANELARPTEVLTREESAAYDYSKMLQEWVEAEVDEARALLSRLGSFGGGLCSDFIGASLSEVNWSELAKTWLEEEVSS